MSRTRKLRLVLICGSILGAISPITVSSSNGIVPAQACADGTCCPEDKSICIINDIRTENAFYKGTGPCINQT
jgi:hypothetical protein